MAAEKNWFDPNTYTEMFKTADMTKMMEGLKMPTVDAGKIAEAQQKNLQAFVEANKVAAEGYQAAFKRQMEIVKEHMEAASAALKDVTGQPMSAETAEKNVETAKASFEKAMADFTELAETVRKANEDAFGIMQTRFNEGVEELKAVAESSEAA